MIPVDFLRRNWAFVVVPLVLILATFVLWILVADSGVPKNVYDP